MQILHGSGDNPANRAFLETLERALPAREFQAVAAWLSTFYGYQQNWLLDPSRFSLLLKCRQIGASHTYAAAAVLWGLLGENTSIVSIGERESSEVLKKVAKHAEALQRLGSSWAAPVARAATRIELASGGVIMALPATSGGRGQSGNVLLDEAAYYEHAEDVWDGAAASAMHGYRIRIMSTPNGVGNMFHKLHKNAAVNGYRVHTVTLADAVADGLRVSEQECWALAKNDPRLFDQLFNCKFLDGEQQYIPTEVIEACTVEHTLGYGGICYAGLDIGKTSDRTELIIVNKDDRGIRWKMYSEGCKRTSWDDIDRLVALAFSPRWSCARLCVDATGMGAYPADKLQERFGRHRVEPVVFTQQSKEDLATSLYSAFVEQTIRIDRGDTSLRDDLCALRRIITTAGNVRYDAPHTDEGHADKAWALALALHGCNSPPNYRHVSSGR